jgi:hypothetical protein
VAPALLHAAESDLQRNGCTFVTLDTTEPLKRATNFIWSKVSQLQEGFTISLGCRSMNTRSYWSTIKQALDDAERLGIICRIPYH